MTIPNDLEYALLSLLEKSDGKWGWHQLATRLSNMDVPRVPDLLTGLRELTSRGLVERRRGEHSSGDGWALTQAGRTVLATTLLSRVARDDFQGSPAIADLNRAYETWPTAVTGAFLAAVLDRNDRTEEAARIRRLIAEQDESTIVQAIEWDALQAILAGLSSSRSLAKDVASLLKRSGRDTLAQSILRVINAPLHDVRSHRKKAPRHGLTPSFEAIPCT